MSRSIIHVDMDAFFASVEQMDNPNIKNKPIAVGGDPTERGVVCAASYEARKYGVRSAMSSKIAKSLCPELIFVPVRMERYISVSHIIHEIFEEYSDLVEPISIDEAFLDVTGKDAMKIAVDLKKRIKDQLGLTASVGISVNKYLAKLASDYDKPDGLTFISQNQAKDFLAPLPVRKIWGVGPKTEKELNRLGIYKIQDIIEYDSNILIRKFGKRGLELLEYAQGEDQRLVESRNRRKSIGEENTFERDLDDIELLKNYIYRYCAIIVSTIHKKQLCIKTVTIKIKYEDFSCITRSVTLPFYTDSLAQISEAAKKLFLTKIKMDKRVRLLGVQVSNILYPDEPFQLHMIFD